MASSVKFDKDKTIQSFPIIHDSLLQNSDYIYSVHPIAICYFTMSFITGYLNILNILQRIFPLPIQLNTRKMVLLPHPSLLSRRPLKYLWRLETCWNIYCIIFSLISFGNSISLWKTSKCRLCLLMHISMCTIYLETSAVVLVTMVTNQIHSHQCSWVTTKFIQMRYDFPSKLSRKFRWNRSTFYAPNLPELLAYTISLSFLAFPIITLGFSVLLAEDPAQLAIYYITKPLNPPPIIVSITGGILTQLHITYGSAIALSYLLLILSGAESTSKVIPLTYSVFRQSFPDCLRIYRAISIIVGQVNYDLSLYVPVLIAFGMAMCVSGLFCAVVLSSSVLPVPVSLGAGLMTFMVYCVIVTLAPFAAVPLTKSIKFLRIWKNVKLFRRERQKLRSCRLLYYRVGPFYICDAKLVLDIVMGTLIWTFNLIVFASV